MNVEESIESEMNLAKIERIKKEKKEVKHTLLETSLIRKTMKWNLDETTTMIYPIGEQNSN